VGLLTHIVIYLTVTKPVREAKARLWPVAPLMMMMIETLLPITAHIFTRKYNNILYAGSGCVSGRSFVVATGLDRSCSDAVTQQEEQHPPPHTHTHTRIHKLYAARYCDIYS
jgi:hypothetical protein